MLPYLAKIFNNKKEKPMKKLLTYTLITTMISCFSYVNPAFADTQIKNENVIKLDLKGTNTFNLAYNNDQLFLANNEIDCSGKQALYILSGGILGGIGGVLLTFVLGIGLASISGSNGEAIGYMTILSLPIGALVGALFGAFKGNESALSECNILNKK